MEGILAGLVLGVIGSGLYWQRQLDHKLILKDWEHTRLLAGYHAALEALQIDRNSEEFSNPFIESLSNFDKDWPPPRPGDCLNQTIQQFRVEQDRERAARRHR